jgi:hypothetical protein
MTIANIDLTNINEIVEAAPEIVNMDAFALYLLALERFHGRSTLDFDSDNSAEGESIT